MSALTPLISFSGDKLDYSDFRREFLNRASTASNTDAHGLLGFVLTPPEWIATLIRAGDANPGPFIPLVHPGERPNAGAQFPAWKADLDAFLKQTQDINAFKLQTRAALDQDSLISLDTDIDQANSRSLRETLTRLDLLHRRLSPADLHRNAAKLMVHYTSGSNIRTFVSVHRRVHLIAQDNNFPFPENEKVKKFVDSLLPCGLFAGRIDTWRMIHSRADDQFFENLAETILDYADNMDVAATSGGFLYSNQVTVQPPSVSSVSPTGLSSDMILAITQCVAAAVQAIVPASTSTPSSQMKTNKRPQHYCWTHGFGGHGSKFCQHPADGHQEGATGNKRLGGSLKGSHNH
jgi:hypothetical protein